MRFIEVSPDKAASLAKSKSRHLNSLQVIKDFLAKNTNALQVDLTGTSISINSFYTSINTYAKHHDIAVRATIRQKELFLVRVSTEDVQEESTPFIK